MPRQGFPNAPGRSASGAFRRSLPFAGVLAFALGVVLFSGANLWTAYPRAENPFGLPGTATFENAVAMVRMELVLAATIVSIVWGARTLASLEPARDSMAAWRRTVATDLFLLWTAIVVAAAIGKWTASETPDDAFLGFTVAHGLLASSFYAIGLAVAVLTRRWAVPAALATGISFVVIYENLVRWQVFRQAGYFALRAGDFPAWYYIAQALSPVAGYRAVLILWRPGFRDGLEHAVLDDAELPDWMTAGNFVLFMAILWVGVPLACAGFGWWLRSRKPLRALDGGLATAMLAADQAGVGDPSDYAQRLKARATSRAADSGPATRGLGVRPRHASGQSAPSIADKSQAESEVGGAGSR